MSTIDYARAQASGCHTVYGLLFNFRSALAALGAAAHAAPYLAPPRAPILYIKPANTWSQHGAPIVIPLGESEIEVGATFGIVISRTAVAVCVTDALDFVAGYVAANDVSLPHLSFYRPAIRARCRDGFCSLGSEVVARLRLAEPDSLRIRAYVNGDLRYECNSRDLVRSVAQVVADVSEFMTLMPGDVLLVGVPACPPTARAGDTVRVVVEGVGEIENPVVAEETSLSGRVA